MQIENSNPVHMPPFLQTGFRPFFLAAILFAIVIMLLWLSTLSLHWTLPLETLTRTQWHGHEMVFGYTVAVISGFLLTAVQNWTGHTTCNGKHLLLVFTSWALTRVLALYPTPETVILMVGSSMIYYLLLIRSLIVPLVTVHNNKQWGIISKVVLLGVLDIVFLCMAAGWFSAEWASPVLLFCVYTVVGLILVMGARVIPGFTKNAVSNSNNIRDWPITGRISLVLYLMFVVSDIFHWHWSLVVSGILLFVVNGIRLWGWYDHEIWYRPLVWVLHMAIAFISIGILARALNDYLQLLPYLSLHLMTYGGIAMITAGMMARVILGHTGRSVFEPPQGLSWVFILITVGTFCRSIIPAFFMDYYFYWVLLSQILWIGAFILMLGFYLIPLVTSRIDGRFG